ncbi:MAG: MerR family transcriptional regulator [Candidatus Dormibacteraeota bacterium]|nr:MerR family transcriptional regulator [Candidatus Dormibacteraeota bacterium]
MMPAPGKAIYSIGAVARMLGIPTATLRAWEERYGVVVPERGEGTQRLYTREEVEQLRYVKRQIDAGLSAADAHRLLEDELSGGGLVEGGDRDGDQDPPLVLIAERDLYAAGVAEYLLKTEGYDVCIALNARGARTIFAERSPQLVILDLLISGGAGFRLCREFSDGGSVQVLAVSALDSAEEALESGAGAFLHKPLEPLQLVSMVRDLFGTSALTREARASIEEGIRSEA